MLIHAEEATEMARGRTRGDLDSDRKLNLSLVRLMEIIGEAASRVSPQAHEQIAAIPWPDVIGLRNRLVHGYDKVDFDVLWDIVTYDLPPLIDALREALQGDKKV
ncbi:MAG: DUF86 domain-containing protein [Actinobacteria bacterium]|nr:DUF86 domain-containing protein [Actinomycetota bacterium]